MKNIYLVGFMATGKTAVGRLLADRLGSEFVDMDELIVQQQKMSIADIFKLKGEPYFREVEKDMVRRLSQRRRLVVACGGGAFVDSENVHLLKQTGLVVCLSASPEMILKRTSAHAHRPLLNTQDPLGRIKALLDKRAVSYAQAAVTIDGDQLTVEEMTDEILVRLRRHG